MGERRGTKALETWCKRVTQGYPGVKVENMTTSWRDGLAFCAMIHHFRPDLIDFSRLDKSDVYGNNDLAFRIAERHLGIPALLDAEDMAEYPVPDRLSILTYLSQFYQTFASNSNSPIKKSTSDSPDNSIVSLTNVQTPPKMDRAPWRETCLECGNPVYLAERLRVQGKLYHRTCFRCARCHTQLSTADYYETQNNQFCCETCPDEDMEPPEVPPPSPPPPIPVEIETSPPTVTPSPSHTASLVAMRKMLFDSYDKDTDDAKLTRSEKSPKPVNSLEIKSDLCLNSSSDVELTTTSNSDSVHIETVDSTETSLDEVQNSPVEFDSLNKEIDSDVREISPPLELNSNKVSEETEIVSEEDPSKTVEITPPPRLKRSQKKPVDAVNKTLVNKIKADEDYPEDLNPFEDDEDDNVKSTNPFGSDSESDSAENSMKKSQSLNPFGSDDDDEEEVHVERSPVPAPRTAVNPVPLPRNSLRGSQRSLASISSFGSVTSRKKKKAPLPPTSPSATSTLKVSPKKQRAPLPPSLTSSRLSLCSDYSRSDYTASGRTSPAPVNPELTSEISNIIVKITELAEESKEESRLEVPSIMVDSVESVGAAQGWSTPIPSRRSVSERGSFNENHPSTSLRSLNSPYSDYEPDLVSLPSEKKNKESVNMHMKNSEVFLDKSTHGQWKRKKAPAPPLPIPQRRHVKPMPLHKIKTELNDIEIKQQGLERQGVALENKIRDKFDTEVNITPYVEEMVLQLFELVNEKNELFRRQAELMYLRRQQHLEEEHAELEYQIRCLMARPEVNKTDCDKELEEKLIQRLVEVVERRDSIVQCLEMDRLREAEEDESIYAQLGIFTQAVADDKAKTVNKKVKKKKSKYSHSSMDLDKDMEESEKGVKTHKKKWYSTLQHLKNRKI